MGYKEEYINKTVLITGATGFIGSYLQDRLLNIGAKVYLMSKNEKKVFYQNNLTKQYFVDIREKNEVINKIDEIKPDFIFHLAADKNRGGGVESFYSLIDINVIGLLNLLNGLVKSNLTIPVITLGTIEEYGSVEIPVTESMSDNPESPYAFSKSSADQLLKLFYKLYNIKAIMLRTTIVYGPKQGEEMFIPSLIKSLNMGQNFKMTPGEQTRDFLYIDDLIEAQLIAGAMHKKTSGEIINVGYGKSYKIKNIAENIGKIMGKSALIDYGAIEYKKNEIMNYSIDVSKAEKLLGWKPKVKLDDGLKRTIEYFMKKE